MNEEIKIPGGKELIDALASLKEAGIEKKMKVADFGCGRRGYFSLQAAKLIGPNGAVYAIDILPSALKSVESLANLFNISNLKTIWANLEIEESTKLPNESMDLVLLNNVLFQTKNHNVILKETKRILKKGSNLLLTEWEKKETPFGPKEKIEKEEAKKKAEAVGLVFEKEFKPGPYHYSLVFKK